MPGKEKKPAVTTAAVTAGTKKPTNAWQQGHDHRNPTSYNSRGRKHSNTKIGELTGEIKELKQQQLVLLPAAHEEH
jgi:hypothetical protein